MLDWRNAVMFLGSAPWFAATACNKLAYLNILVLTQKYVNEAAASCKSFIAAFILFYCRRLSAHVCNKCCNFLLQHLVYFILHVQMALWLSELIVWWWCDYYLGLTLIRVYVHFCSICGDWHMHSTAAWFQSTADGLWMPCYNVLILCCPLASLLLRLAQVWSVSVSSCLW